MEDNNERNQPSADFIVTVSSLYLPDRPLLATEERLTIWEATKITLKRLVPTSGSSILVIVTAGASVKIVGLLGTQYYEATSLTTLLEYAMLPFSAMLTPIITMTARVNPAQRFDNQIPPALGNSLRTSYIEPSPDQINPAETGKIAHAGIIVASICIVPLAFLFRFSAETLTGLRQPTELIPIAASFCQPYIGGIPSYLYSCVLNYIANPLGMQMPVFISQLVSGALGIGLGALLVLKTDLAERGMSIGIDFQYLATFGIMLAIYLYKNRRDPQFREFGLFRLHAPTLWQHLKSLIPYIKEISKMGSLISLYAIIVLSNFFLTTLFMGWHGAPYLAAQLTVQIWLLLVGIINFSLGEVANLLVGKYHAAGRMADTRMFGKVTLSLGLAWNILAIIFFETIPGPLTRVFINGDDPHIQELAINLMQHIAPSTLFAGECDISGGLARGLTKVAMTAFTAALSNIALNIPLTYFLSIKLGYGLPGMAWARNISLFVGMTIQVVYWFYLADTTTGVSSRLTRTIDAIIDFIKDKLLCCCRRPRIEDEPEPILLPTRVRSAFFLPPPPPRGQETDALVTNASVNADEPEPPRSSWRDNCVIC